MEEGVCKKVGWGWRGGRRDGGKRCIKEGVCKKAGWGWRKVGETGGRSVWRKEYARRQAGGVGR